MPARQKPKPPDSQNTCMVSHMHNQLHDPQNGDDCLPLGCTKRSHEMIQGQRTAARHQPTCCKQNQVSTSLAGQQARWQLYRPSRQLEPGTAHCAVLATAVTVSLKPRACCADGTKHASAAQHSAKPVSAQQTGRPPAFRRLSWLPDVTDTNHNHKPHYRAVALAPQGPDAPCGLPSTPAHAAQL